MKAYELQVVADDWRYGHELVRSSDGQVVCTDTCEPEDATFARHFSDVVEELNRLALENEKLREGRDEALRSARREIEQLRLQLETMRSESEGQLRLLPNPS